MKTPDDIKKEGPQPAVELEEYAGYAKERLTLLLRNLPKEEMIAKINELHLSDKSLDFLCQGIALGNEDYEICAAVMAIKKERTLNTLQL